MRFTFCRHSWLALVLGGVVALMSCCLRPGWGAESIEFARDIRPILSDHCFHCHGPDAAAREADLRLDTRDGLFRVRDDKATVVPHDEAASELLRRVTSDDPAERMPPPDTRASLSADQIARLRSWIRAGAPWQGHWSLQPIVAATIPRAAFPDPPATQVIDRFVHDRLRSERLEPSEEASRERLLRRVTFDLTGLPPTLAELDRFAQDRAPDAYERVVDRLLASPHYGERMAWDWLDAARYADSNGFQGDNERTMWPWRDWVVRALNANLPFDEFTRWQLAGDRLPEPTAEQLLATGFCRNHMINGEGGRIPEENRVEYVFDQLETMGTVWLGMTLQCSRCHDHKFDAITRREYYQLFAFFNQTPVDGSGGNPQTPPNLAWPSRAQQRALTQQQQVIDASLQQLDVLTPSARAQLDQVTFAEEDRQVIQAAWAETWSIQPDDRLDRVATLVKAQVPEFAAALQGYRNERRALADLQKTIPRVMIMGDRDEPRATTMLDKGQYNRPQDVVEPQTPEALPPMPSVAAARRHDRWTVAEWLLQDRHPLTARVTVNRHWQLFFGQGLVRTPEDFGAQGERPTHPELLDWLAHDLIHHGWDVKRLHRQIVLSATYRQSAQQRDARDPDNRWLSRGPRQRMPAWMLRDQALAASQLWQRSIGGTPVFPYQPSGVWSEATFGKKDYSPSHGADLYRRSLYTFWRRIVGPTNLFDVSKRQTCSVRVPLTNTPLQALTILNDVTYLEAARALATHTMTLSDDVDSRLQTAFRLVTSRSASAQELAILRNRWSEWVAEYTRDDESAQQVLAAGEAKLVDMGTPAERAAYTAIGALLLNLDESQSK